MPKHNYRVGNDRIAEHCKRHLPDALNRISGIHPSYQTPYLVPLGLQAKPAHDDSKSIPLFQCGSRRLMPLYFVVTCKILQLCTSLILRFHSPVIPDSGRLFFNSNARRVHIPCLIKLRLGIIAVIRMIFLGYER
jgi:hypothetical protein